jgi:hypothetical protein
LTLIFPSNQFEEKTLERKGVASNSRMTNISKGRSGENSSLRRAFHSSGCVEKAWGGGVRQGGEKKVKAEKHETDGLRAYLQNSTSSSYQHLFQVRDDYPKGRSFTRVEIQNQFDEFFHRRIERLWLRLLLCLVQSLCL